MKRLILPLLVALLATGICLPAAWAATGTATKTTADRSPGAPMAHALSTVTGIAISPLLGTSAYGAYQWFTADAAARAALPWYAQPKFWVPALLLVAVCAAKDSFGAAVPPPLKKPLDALEVVENKASGLVAAGAVIPVAMDAFSKMLLGSGAHATAAAGSTGLALLPPLAVNWAPALDLLTVPFGIAVFLVVWMASHAINVLILLSPWGGVDAALKAARTSLLGLLVAASYVNPWIGALLSLAVIVVAYFVAGWAFRLTVFGAVVSWDFFTGRRGRYVPAVAVNRMFAGTVFSGVPVRTYGRLGRRADGALEFTYRPWLVLKPRTVSVTASATSLAVGAGAFFSIITPAEGGTLFLLPPRYRGHEARLVEQYGLGGGVQPAGLRKAWHSVKELIGGRASSAPVAAAAPRP